MLLAEVDFLAFMWGSEPSLFGQDHLFSYVRRKNANFVFYQQKVDLPQVGLKTKNQMSFNNSPNKDLSKDFQSTYLSGGQEVL